MRTAAIIAVLILLTPAALGALRFGLPKFESGYEMPPVTTPGPGDHPGIYPFPASWPFVGRYIDAVLLSAVVALGVYLVLKKRPFHSLVALAGVLLVYFGLWDGACRHLVAAATRLGERLFGEGYPGGWASTAERILNLATPLIVLAAVGVWAVRKRSRHGILLLGLLAGLHACIWWDGHAGSGGMIRRVAWLFGAADYRPVWPFAYEYLDVALLAAALLAAAYLALKARSRDGLVTLMVFSLLHFGFWRQGCICPIGAVQTVSLAICDRAYLISPIVVLFFLLPLLVAVWAGRAFCAAVCPLGAIQDVVVVRAVRVPAWLAHALGLLAWVYLGLAVLLAAVGSAFIICEYDPFVALFRLEGSTEMLLLGGCFLVMGLFVARPYCRFLCPYGAVLRVLSAVSLRRVKITPAECVQCRLCEDTCPFGAIRPSNVDAPPAPRSAGKGVLAALLIAAPVLVVLGGWLGGRLAAPLARTHQMVRLAEQIAGETRAAERLPKARRDQVTGLTDATAALWALEKSARHQRQRQIHDEAARVESKFAVGSWLLGGFIGLVVALKLIALTVRRRREDYEADPATCLSCGRCFEYCPVEIQRRKEGP